MGCYGAAVGGVGVGGGGLNALTHTCIVIIWEPCCGLLRRLSVANTWAATPLRVVIAMLRRLVTRVPD